MKFRSVFLIATTLLIAPAFSQAASLKILGKASPSKSTIAPDATMPGYGLGILGVGPAVTGLPTFPADDALEISIPKAFVVGGNAAQYYFTLQTTTFSGNLTVAFSVVQHGVLIYLVSGVLAFDSGLDYVVSTNDSIIPNSPGAASLIATVSDGTNTITQTSKILIAPAN